MTRLGSFAPRHPAPAPGLTLSPPSRNYGTIFRLVLVWLAVVLAGPFTTALAQQPAPTRLIPADSFTMPALTKATREAVAQAARQAELVVLVDPWVRIGDLRTGWACCALLAVYKGGVDPEHQLLWLPQSLLGLDGMHTRRGSCGQLLALAADANTPGGWRRVDLPRNLPHVPAQVGGWLNEFEHAVQSASQPPVTTQPFLTAPGLTSQPNFLPTPVLGTTQIVKWIEDLDFPGPRQQEAMIELARQGEQAQLALLKAAVSERWERAKRAKQLLTLLDGGSSWQGLRLRLIGPTQQVLRVRDRVTFTLELVNLTRQTIWVDGGRPGAFEFRLSDGNLPTVNRTLQTIPNPPADWTILPFATVSIPVEVQVNHVRENGDVLSLISPLGSPPIGKNKLVSVEAWFQDPGPAPDPISESSDTFIGPPSPPRPTLAGRHPTAIWPGGRLRSNSVSVRIEP